MVTNAADRLIDRICEKGAPIVVGIDPVLGRLPDIYTARRTPDFPGAAAAIEAFGCDIIDGVADIAPAIKPQSAFFELYGSYGIHALENVCAYARERNLVVIEDAKCNDIGSTAAAYAAGHIGTVEVPGGSSVASSIDADFLTVSPYTGVEGLQPFIDLAASHGKGIFVLVKTSNPGSLLLQGAMTDEGVSVGSHVAQIIDAAGESCRGRHGYAPIGAVIGATYPGQAADFRRQMPHALFLVPGYGAQGAGAREVAPCFNDDGLGAVVNSSRGIIYAYAQDAGPGCTAAEYQDSTRAAAAAMRDDIRGVLLESCPRMEY